RPERSLRAGIALGRTSLPVREGSDLPHAHLRQGLPLRDEGSQRWLGRRVHLQLKETNMRSAAPLILVMLAACSASAPGDDTNELLDAYSSSEAVLLDFEFDGSLAASNAWDAKSAIEDQLLYTIGHLNGDRSVGRLDAVELTNVKTTAGVITYHAKLPVSWGKKSQIPTSYEFTLPKSDDYGTFTSKYMHDCVDFGAHEVTSGSMWYYYRPHDS